MLTRFINLEGDLREKFQMPAADSPPGDILANLAEDIEAVKSSERKRLGDQDNSVL